jgi:site-specific DNA-methyltransferase (cytosine-N4-specific)
MRKLLEDAKRYYTPKKRPSGHDISGRFADRNGGAIPPNLLEIPNTESNSPYLRFCKLASIEPHPARFPEKLPAFFIDFLTNPADLVVDIFAGSNTTGAAAERAARHWIAFESNRDYLAASVFRFLGHLPEQEVLSIHESVRTESGAPLEIQVPVQERLDFAPRN